MLDQTYTVGIPWLKKPITRKFKVEAEVIKVTITG